MLLNENCDYLNNESLHIQTDILYTRHTYK